MIPDSLKSKMKKQGYHFVGNHSCIKICEYTSNALRNRELCYKSKFYGIKSWQCMQVSLSIGCDLSCRFCWRIIPEEMNLKWNELNVDNNDDPGQIIEGFIAEQRKIVSGYKTDYNLEQWDQANNPVHAAISLTGESLFYKQINELIKLFHSRKISTFVVTNGTLPEVIEKLEPPTQLYISLQAPNKEAYENVTRPKLKNSWNRFTKSLKILKNMRPRNVLRMSLVKNLNMFDEEGYAKLIKIAMPDYVEVKGFSFVGGARGSMRNLKYTDMPVHNEIREFADKIAESSSYIVSNEHKTSRIVLLSRDEEAKNAAKIDFNKLFK